MKKISILFAIVISFLSCKESIEYQFTESPETIRCEGLDYDLAHEAYYSFREDLANYTKKTKVSVDRMDYQYSLASFIFNGASGDADYSAIASDHTLRILDLLKQEKQIWVNTDTGELNYNSEFLTCLIDNIQNEEIKTSLTSLKQVNGIHKYSLAETYRMKVMHAEKDNYLAMFFAFETYYKYLSKINH